MPASASTLFEPYVMPGLVLPNRVVMAPMTRESSVDGVPTPEVADYYARRASGGVGLIITEATDVAPSSWGGRTRVPRFYGADALEGWAQVVGAVHAAGGRIAPQLWHIGAEKAVAGDLDPADLLSPSGLATDGSRAGRPMTHDDIEATILAFGQAAAHAYELGFDGIELQGGHGFLIDQFLWAVTNRREDEYGGDLVARTRFAAGVVRACRAATTPEFPIIMRISQWKVSDFGARLAHNPEELKALLAPLAAAGVDIFDCSTRRYWNAEFSGWTLNLAGWVKRVTGKPTITVGNIGLSDGDFMQTFYIERCGSDNAGLGQLEEMLGRGEVDLAGVGRVLIADARWPQKVRNGESDLIPFRPEMVDVLD